MTQPIPPKQNTFRVPKPDPNTMTAPPVNGNRPREARSEKRSEGGTGEARVSEPRRNRERTARPSIPAWSFDMSRLKPTRQTYIVGGMLLLLLGASLLAAFVSYFFTGVADQSVATAPGVAPLTVADTETENWVGRLGAFVAHVFIFRWFGIGALCLPIIMALAGYKLAFRYEPVPLARATSVLLFFTFWLSLILGYVVLATGWVQAGSVWCGGVGYLCNVALRNLMGWGSIFVLVFALFAFWVFYYNITTLRRPTLSRTTDTADDSADSLEEPTTDVAPERPMQVVGRALTFDRYKEDEAVEDEDEPEAVSDSEETTPHTNGVPFQSITTAAADAAPNVVPPHVAETPPVRTGPTLIVDDPSAVADAPVQLTTPTFEPEEAPDLAAAVGMYDPTLELAGYQYPTPELMADHPVNQRAQVSADELEANKDRIVETLQNYNITIDHIKATIGPTVTLYEIVPSAGTRISKIKSLEDDIALSLAALGIRIIAPMPGKGTIGIEVPNKNREMVSIRSMVTSEKFQKAQMDLPVVLGKTISNEIMVADLAKMPHLLMAGATGQGKSVGLNVLLTSLLYKKHPSQLKLVLVDPKKVELTLFNKIERHFLAKLPDAEEAIITDTKKVVNTLNSLCIEMDGRYNLLKEAGCRNLKEYNAKFVQRRLNPERGHRYLPYIVLVIDELADLMMTAGKEVEQPIARLAQLARAIGIHLVVATQRPSVNVITGLIKANFPARLSFKVTSKVDSRTILDTGGAEQLVGMGDMLLSQNSDLIRLQCPFADTDEIEAICEFIGGQRGYDDAYHLPEFYGDDGGSPAEEKDVDLANRDPMFDEAARLVVIHQQGSTSLIQRRLKLGYNRAGRLIDQLEAAGIVGPFEGSKARDVLVHDAQALEEMLKNLN